MRSPERARARRVARALAHVEAAVRLLGYPGLGAVCRPVEDARDVLRRNLPHFEQMAEISDP